VATTTTRRPDRRIRLSTREVELIYEALKRSGVSVPLLRRFAALRDGDVDLRGHGREKGERWA